MWTSGRGIWADCTGQGWWMKIPISVLEKEVRVRFQMESCIHVRRKGGMCNGYWKY